MRYAVLGIELYQRKGYDFSEELCSHFVRACVMGKSPETAVNVFSKYKNRISAWLTATSLQSLLVSLIEQGKIEQAVQTVEMAVRKGVRPAPDSVRLLTDKVNPALTGEQMKDLRVRTTALLETIHDRWGAVGRGVGPSEKQT